MTHLVGVGNIVSKQLGLVDDCISEMAMLVMQKGWNDAVSNVVCSGVQIVLMLYWWIIIQIREILSDHACVMEMRLLSYSLQHQVGCTWCSGVGVQVLPCLRDYCFFCKGFGLCWWCENLTKSVNGFLFISGHRNCMLSYSILQLLAGNT